MSQYVIERNLISSTQSQGEEFTLEQQVNALCDDTMMKVDALYATDDKLYLILVASSKEQVRQQALRCGFVIHRIGKIEWYEAADQQRNKRNKIENEERRVN